MAPKKCKKGDFWAKMPNFYKKLPFFALFGCEKIEKNAKIKNPATYVFSKSPKEHFYQFLDQLDHFPNTSLNFYCKGRVRSTGSEKRKKTPFFGNKTQIFWADFFKIFKINENHLITKVDQILGGFDFF